MDAFVNYGVVVCGGGWLVALVWSACGLGHAAAASAMMVVGMLSSWSSSSSSTGRISVSLAYNMRVHCQGHIVSVTVTMPRVSQSVDGWMEAVVRWGVCSKGSIVSAVLYLYSESTTAIQLCPWGTRSESVALLPSYGGSLNGGAVGVAGLVSGGGVDFNVCRMEYKSLTMTIIKDTLDVQFMGIFYYINSEFKEGRFGYYVVGVGGR